MSTPFTAFLVVTVNHIFFAGIMPRTSLAESESEYLDILRVGTGLEMPPAVETLEPRGLESPSTVVGVDRSSYGLHTRFLLWPCTVH